MKTIDVRQIKAARAALDWTREDLAGFSGVPFRTLARIETGEAVGKKKQLDQIQSAFENSGVRFTEHSGVLFQPERIKFVESKDPFLVIIDDIKFHLRDRTDREIFYLFADNSKTSPALLEAEQRLRDSGIRIRQIVEKNCPVVSAPIEDSRTIPPEHFQNVFQVIYGDKIATSLVERQEVMVLWDARLASLQRKIFDYYWETGNSIND